MSNQENISKETKKTRRKKSHRKAQQIKLAVIMIMVSVLVLSASTFAWYQMNKTANLTNMQFTADTLGNLLISANETDGYTNTLNLNLDSEKVVLLPTTTSDGETFYEPDYKGTSDSVSGVKDLTADNYSKYVYKKVFYIKSGEQVNNEKKYYLKLVDGFTDSDGSFNAGTYLKDTDRADDTKYTSLDAVRVSLVFGTGAVDLPQGTVKTIKVFQPYSDSNNDIIDNGDIIAQNELASTSYGPKMYKDFTLTQHGDGQIAANDDEDTTLCTISEGTPVEVTMYVWFEGTDNDCGNGIALDTIAGQIQFEAVEKND